MTLLLGSLLLPLSLLSVTAAPGGDEEPAPTVSLTRNQIDELAPWRSIGPANMGGRTIAYAVANGDPSTYWVGTASGGLLKTTNRGVSYEHQFDTEECVSIGHVAVAPSDPDIVWVGTGEANPRNSVSYGCGVFRSVDGGTSWRKMGLEESFQIGRIAIHPTDPDIVYVGALGRLWGEGGERGLYKTTDGGKHWERVLYVDERTGVIDVDMHPENPDVLIVATYERARDLYDTNDPAKKWGPGGGLWRTEDGGATWTRLADGLPGVQIGRSGVDWHRADPNVVYAIVETERIGKLSDEAAFFGVRGEDAEVGVRVVTVDKESPAAAAGLEKGDILLRIDGQHIKSWEELEGRLRGLAADETVELEYVREREAAKTEVALELYPTDDRGRALFSMILGGQKQNVQDEQGRDAVDMGGVYKSEDAGLTWTRVNSLNPRPMYFSQIRVDPSDPNYVYVLGINLWRSSDGGVTFTPDGHGDEVHVDHHALWIDPDDGRHMLLGNDGGIYVTWDRMESWDHHNHVAMGQFYHVSCDTRLVYNVYGGLQDNGTWGGPSRTFGPSGALNTDWFFVGQGDGFVSAVDAEDPSMVYFESQNGAMGRVDIDTGRRSGVGPRAEGLRLRFNWKTPFILSTHDSSWVYAVSSHALRSYRRGASMDVISPELTRTSRGSGTAISESPLDENVLYAGTDDGALWVTRSGGRRWQPIIGAPEETNGRVSMEMMFAEAVRALDADGDGTLAASEVPERLSKWLASGDLDEDGSLSAEELDAHLEHSADNPRLLEFPSPNDRWLGRWRGELQGDAVKRKARRFTLEIELDPEGELRGELDSKMFGEGELRELEVDEESGALRCRATTPEGAVALSLTSEGARLTGEVRAAGGFVVIALEAERSGGGAIERDEVDPTPDGKPLAELVPGPMHVATLEASRYEAGRIYVALDGHRSDDDRPYVFRSEDFGATWVSLGDDLPRGSARVLREDAHNEDLLYLGTEFGAWCSLDRGRSWSRMGHLPTVAVHDFAQPPGQDEVVAATHGRSLWITDVSALRRATAATLGDEPSLFEPGTAWYWRGGLEHGRPGTRVFEAENPDEGCRLAYYLPERAKPTLRIESTGGEVVREFDDLSGTSGVHAVFWDLRSSRRGSDGELGLRGRVDAGEYRVVLEVDGREWSEAVTVRELVAD